LKAEIKKEVSGEAKAEKKEEAAESKELKATAKFL